MAYHDMIVCSYPNCFARLKSVQSFELHVNMAHQHRCNECGMDFTSERLLDMHISELHDSYFAVLAKKRPSYQCVVEGCPELFWNNKERRKHLLSVHNFPWTYDFHESAKYRRMRKHKLKRDQRRTESGVDMNEDEGEDEQEEDMDLAPIVSKKGKNKKENKKKEKDAMNSDVMDIDDELSSSLSKMRLVPDKLSFGRGGRGRGFERVPSGRGRGRGRGRDRGRGWDRSER